MKRNKVFLNGIAGTGMSSLAGLFKDSGYLVSGSDSNFYPPIDKILESMGVDLFEGYNAENIPENIDFCVIGNIISRGNPEAEYILDNKIAYYSMADALYKFFIKKKKSIVVAGTHGKTTISSFLAFLLEYSKNRPGYFIGGKPFDLSSNYKLGDGEYFVSEGDEYETSFFDRSSKFLKYFPDQLILTSLEYDHLDFFKTENQYISAFKNLVNQVPSKGSIIFNADFKMNQDVVQNSFAKTISYGSKESDYIIRNIEFKNNGYNFELKNLNKVFKYKTPLLGKYNIWNLSAGIIFGLNNGLSEKVIEEAVSKFKGVERRLNKIKVLKNTVFLEDFAHHHTAIKNVINSLSEIYPDKKKIVLFEPGSFSIKLNTYQDDLIDSFQNADEIIVKNPFSDTGEKKDRLDLNAFKSKLNKMGKKVHIFEDFDNIKDWISNCNFEKDQVIILLSNKSFGHIPTFVKNLK